MPALSRLRHAFAVTIPLVLLSIALFSPEARAQGANGTITGTIADATGAVLPGATVTIRHDETGFTRELTTSPNGRFSAPDLPPGPYTVTATLSGFATVARRGIVLTVGREAVVDFTMAVGQLSDVVTVTGETSTIETGTSSTGGLIAEDQIKNLPLNGRSYIELANLTPGVQLTNQGGRSTSTGFGQKISVNGSRYTQNLFTLDGTMMNDQFNQAGSASGNMLGVEAVREFQVLTNSFSAEYGRHTGAVVNAATKTGTNVFHGSVFEFHRDEALDAKRWEAKQNNLPKPDFTRNQFGFSAGGPILRERTFFFTTYEGLRERLGQTNTFNVPTAAVRAAANSIVRPYLDAFPMPNGVVLDAQRAEYVRQDSRNTDEHYAMVRVDHQFTTNSKVFGRYTFNDGQVTNPNRVNTGEVTKTRLQYATVEHQLIRGAGFVNRAQLGYTASRLDGYDYVLDGITMPRLTFTDIDRGIGALTITGLAAWGGSTTNPKFHRFSNVQLSDTATWVRGSHNFRVGGHMEYQMYDLTSDFTSMGSYNFRSIDDFLLVNRARTFDAVQPGSDTSRRIRQSVFGFFVQDDWRVRRDFTVNAGLRYEPTTDITEADGKLSQLIDFASPTARMEDAVVVDAIVKNPSYKTIAPRLGFAWNVGGSGKTAVRGGAGVFYDLLTANTNFVQNTAVRVPPFFIRSRITGTTTTRIDFPDAYFNQAALLAGNAQLEGIQYDPDQPMVTKWNLNVQRELWSRTSVEVGYTGARGFNLFRQIYTNGFEASEINGRLVVLPGTPMRQPNFGRMRLRVSDADSWYKGLTVSLTRRTTDIQLQTAYTLGKSEDTGAAALGGNDYDNEGGGSRYFFMKEKGLSPFDVRHSLVASVNWAMPFGRDGQGAAMALVRNWNVGTLVRLRSGDPFSVNTGGLQRGAQPDAPDYPDLCPGASANPVLGGTEHYFDPTAFCLQPQNVIGNAPRNSVIGPGFATVDLMVSRALEFGGTRNVQLRLEVFNLLNRSNFALPQAGIFNPDGTYRADAGRITSTTGTPRQVQLGAKIVW
jgi:carboxypeptidase family protein/TonB-dependent receptor-like protein